MDDADMPAAPSTSTHHRAGQRGVPPQNGGSIESLAAEDRAMQGRPKGIDCQGVGTSGVCPPLLAGGCGLQEGL